MMDFVIPGITDGQLTQIIQRIVGAVDPEIIICFGGRSLEVVRWGTFVEDGGYRSKVNPSLDLLIITSPDDKHHEYEIIQTVEQQAVHPVTLNCISKQINEVNDAIKANNPFYCSMSLKGEILYNAGRQTLNSCDTIPLLSTSAEWDRLFGQARHFLSVASHSFSCGWHSLTMFLLHQAVENSCNALVRHFTGYHPTTHNLVRLLSLTEIFSRTPMSIFPCSTKAEIDLLHLLSRAYSEARYKANYEIPADKIATLLDRAKAFIEAAGAMHKMGREFLEDHEAAYYSLIGKATAFN